jgi:hypothetical protein
MTSQKPFYVDQSTQPIKTLSVKCETQAQRLQRLKRIADATGKRFIHVYLEDERKQKGNQR